MPWKGVTVPDRRVAFVYLVREGKSPVAAACRTFGISRKTGYKWLKRYQPAVPLVDLSRRPRHSPARTDDAIEAAILEVRDQYGWGPRKIRAFLVTQLRLELPSIRTVANILTRHDRIKPPKPAPQPIQFFERSEPNELWQCDFKG